ncbi:LysR substrate-binding domain-containing protein [Erwinia sp.]|uniref:LysR family transcriptional regulator n=1 Tax=Erwinia citreus TaxID=558 RepID=UPI003C778B44
MHRSGLIELEVVMAVARRGSFRAASRELGMSATAVSSAVAGLEARLETRLFNRTTRSVALTEAGVRYLDRIGPALNEIRQASEEIGSHANEPAGTLRLNVPVEVASLFFNAILKSYLQQYPQMKLEIVSEARLVDIVAEGFDAGVRLAESVPQDMIAVALTGDLRMRIVGSPDYFTRCGKPSSPDELQQHVGLGMRMSHGGIYRWELTKQGEAIEVAVPSRAIFTDMRTLREAALAGIGLAFISEFQVAEDLRLGNLISVLDEWSAPFAGLRLYYPGHRHVPAGLKALVAMIQGQKKGFSLL